MEDAQQELMFKFRMFEQQIKQLQQQIQAVEQGIGELSSLDIGLDELKGSKGKEIMAPIGRGIYIKAKLLSEELTVDIGRGNFIKKSISDTKRILGEQINKLKDIKEELEDNLEKVGKELEKTMMESQNNIHPCGDNCTCKENRKDKCECK
jgi:prefoldin alpha subunit